MEEKVTVAESETGETLTKQNKLAVGNIAEDKQNRPFDEERLSEEEMTANESIILLSGISKIQSQPEKDDALQSGLEGNANSEDSPSCSDSNFSVMSMKLEETCQDNTLHLDLLPSEILIHIASFLNAEFIISVLSKVSIAFHQLINDSSFWRVRLRTRWPKKYPALPVQDEEFDWKVACIERENEFQRWSTVTDSMDYFTFKYGLYGAVDTVHLMEHGRLLAIGSRDRYLNLLDLTKLDKDDPESTVSCRIFCKENAHDGWIWSISSCDKIMATGSWDTRIKFWDLTTMAQMHVARAHSAILCSHFESNYYVAGSYDKNVYHFDLRSAEIQCKKRYHSKPILCLAANDDYVITGSEDASVAVYDRRASAVTKKLKLSQYPMSMCYDNGQLWIGDKGGLVHLLDATAGDLRLIQTYSVGHTQMVTGIIHTSAVLITCSTDRTIKVLEPSLNPGLIANLTDSTAEVAEISYQNGLLACASSGMFVGIYRPKDDAEHEDVVLKYP